MNIHPILVHFPIALLSIYSILEVIRTKKLARSKTYFSLKAFIVIAGTIGAIGAFSTGDDAVSSLAGSSAYTFIRPIIRVHENFAQYTLIFFIVIAISYIIILLSEWKPIKNLRLHWLSGEMAQNIWGFFYRIAEFIQRPWIITTLAIAGFVLVVVTGTLGGLIVYGPNSDPFVHVVAQIFFPTLLSK